MTPVIFCKFKELKMCNLSEERALPILWGKIARRHDEDLIQIFIQNFEVLGFDQEIKKLAAAFHNQNFEELIRRAHNLKSNSE